MRSLKSVFGIISTLFGIAYCGGLVFYFLDFNGSMQEARSIGLGPTVMGLGAIGALFVVVLIIQFVRLILKARSSGQGDAPEAPPRGGKGGFDAEAAFQRYMAQRTPNDTPPARPSAPASRSPSSTNKGFGRRK